MKGICVSLFLVSLFTVRCYRYVRACCIHLLKCLYTGALVILPVSHLFYCECRLFSLPFIYFLGKNNEPGAECCILMLFNKNEALISVMDLMGFLFFFGCFSQVTAGVPLPKEYMEEVTFFSCCDS